MGTGMVPPGLVWSACFVSFLLSGGNSQNQNNYKTDKQSGMLNINWQCILFPRERNLEKEISVASETW